MSNLKEKIMPTSTPSPKSWFTQVVEHMRAHFTNLTDRVLDESSIKLLMIGSHENFYRELNRLES